MLTVLSGPDAGEAVAALILVADSGVGVLRSPPRVKPQVRLDDQIMRAAQSQGLSEPPAMVDFLVDELGADALLPRLPSPFSRGELQIAGLLLTFARPFSSWILDQPTAGLDAKRRRVVADLIIDLADDHEIVCATDDPFLLDVG